MAELGLTKPARFRVTPGLISIMFKPVMLVTATPVASVERFSYALQSEQNLSSSPGAVCVAGMITFQVRQLCPRALRVSRSAISLQIIQLLVLVLAVMQLAAAPPSQLGTGT